MQWSLKTPLARLFLLAILLPPALLFANTVDDLKVKIEERNSQIKQLEEEIEEYQKQLETTGKEKQSLQVAIANLNLSQKKLATELKLTQNKIASTNLRLEELSFNIEDKTKRLERNSKSIGHSIRDLQMLEANSFVEVLLNYNNVSDLWNEMESLERVQGTIKQNSDIVRQLKTELENTKDEVEIQKKHLVNLKSKLADQEKILEYNRKEKANLLATTKNKEANYKKILATKKALRDDFEKELLEFESQLKFELDPSKLPQVGSGIIHWPLDTVKITQYFGNTAFAMNNPQIYNGYGHNGVDFRASMGTPIKAALGGVVVGVGNTDLVCPGASYGKWALIEHGNGLSTLYAHFSLVKVAAGQHVDTGEIIGYSGDTGYATGPHLHFTLYATQAVNIVERKSRVCSGKYRLPVAGLNGYLNPLSYL